MRKAVSYGNMGVGLSKLCTTALQYSYLR